MGMHCVRQVKAAEVIGRFVEAEVWANDPEGRGRWGIYTRSRAQFLGIVEWYRPWRQFIFVPATNTVYSAGCLKDIAAFLVKQ